MTIGVVLVTYNSADFIMECLESLISSIDVDLRIVIVDNASSDCTVDTLRAWANGKKTITKVDFSRPYTPLEHGAIPLIEEAKYVSNLRQGECGLICSSENLGFAGGVNLGLEALISNTDVNYFWIINPDCMTASETAARLEARAIAAKKFAVIGGRVFYTHPPNTIQVDGGRINMWTGICVPYNMTLPGDSTEGPDEATLDYISGSHMFISRTFIERAGLMPEDYFLYYEEMDWCHRRGDLPLLFETAAAVHHHGGATIGSATMTKGPSPLSAYFLNRARMKFIAKYHPIALPLVATYSTARALRALLRGQNAAGIAALRGIWGMPPTSDLMAKIGRDSLPPVRRVTI